MRGTWGRPLRGLGLRLHPPSGQSDPVPSSGVSGSLSEMKCVESGQKAAGALLAARPSSCLLSSSVALGGQLGQGLGMLPCPQWPKGVDRISRSAHWPGRHS